MITAGLEQRPDDQFVGRKNELATLVSWFADPQCRLVTILGTAGVGKTRLAVELARRCPPRFTAGVAWIPLREERDPRRVLPAIARQLGITDEETRLPARLLDALRDQRLLLILDNVEQLLAAADDLAGLLAACSELALLTTSRHPLHLAEERVLPLAPLPYPVSDRADRDELTASPAVQLLVARIAETRGAVPVQADELAAVAAICRRLDGIPLAIELAAGWSRLLRPRELLQRLDDRLGLLRDQSRPDDHHATMREAIGWSYDLLDADQRALFRRLAVFAGGFDLTMATAMIRGRNAGDGYPFAAGYGLPFPFTHLMGHDPTVPPHGQQDPTLSPALPSIPLGPLDGLGALVDHNLLQRLDREEDTQARFGFAEIIRDYGLEQLALTGEEAATRHAHAAAMLAFAEASSEGLMSARRRLWGRQRIDAELPNLRQALTWTAGQRRGSAELAGRLAGNLWAYWQSTGRAGEGRVWLEQALAMEGMPHWVRAMDLPALAFLCWMQGGNARAHALLEEALPLTREVGLLSSEGSVFLYRALLAWQKGLAQAGAMVEHLQTALELFQRAQDAVGIGSCILALGFVARLQGDAAGALARFTEARRLLESTGYEWGIATAQLYAGQVSWELAGSDRSRLTEAIHLLATSLELFHVMDDHWGAGTAVAVLAEVAGQAGDVALAAQLFGAASAMLEGIGAFLPPFDPDSSTRAAAALRQRMGEQAFDRAFAEGRVMPPTVAIDLALTFARHVAERDAIDPLDALTPKQAVLIRDLLAQFPDGEAFTVKEFARVRGLGVSAVYDMLGKIARRWGLAHWSEIPPFLRSRGVAARLPTPPA